MNTPRLTSLRQGRDANGSAAVANGSPKLRPPRRPEITTAPAQQEPKPSRRLLQPLPLAGVVLVLIAVIAYWSVYASSTKRTPILVATHALPAGTVLSAGDLRTGELAGEGSVLDALVPEHELQQVIGRRLSSEVPAGAPLASGAMGSQHAQTSSEFTLAVPEYDVTGTTLQAGERITVLATFNAGGGQSATTRPVARDVQVLTVGEAPANSDPSTTTVPVTISLSSPSVAPSLALANEDAKIDLLVEGSGGSTSPIPSVNPGSVE
ncbi:MAG TPA: RcpC/CpaB family pilus assembly protein [Solirubrobacteraceae bacterium]|nr:RcpC/CpaB family pilus assembly protein [Solirubrobacteraceae bacterium]